MKDNNQNVLEALDSLRNKPLKSTSIERIRLSAEADDRVKGLPQPLQLGNGFKYIMENISVSVKSHDLIVGRIAEKVLTNEEEIEFYGYLRRFPTVREVDRYFPTVTASKIILGGCRPDWLYDQGHVNFDWARILEIGLSGLKGFAQRKLAQFIADGDTQKVEFERGAIMVYEGYQVFAKRYADSCREKGLFEAAEVCEAISVHEPRTFRQALQLIWLIAVVFCGVVAPNPTLTLGHMDRLLYPFYKKEIESEVLTREEAGDLIEDLYCKITLLTGKGDHQLSNSNFMDDPKTDTGWNRNLNYDSPTYMILGGMDLTKKCVANDLTELMIEKIHPRFENPFIVFRYNDDLNDVIWKKLVDKLRQNGSIAIYNDNEVIPALVAGGAPFELAVNYVLFGCNWCTLSADSAYNEIGDFKPLEILLDYLAQHDYGSASPFGNVTKTNSMEDIYEYMRQQLYPYVKAHVERILNQRHRRGGIWPNLLDIEDCFFAGPVENGCNSRYGGVKYECISLVTAFIGSAIDSLFAVQELLFNKNDENLKPLNIAQAVGNNFVGFSHIRKRMLDFDKYGQDNETVDEIGIKLIDVAFETATKVIEDLDAENEVIFIHSLETDTKYLRAFGLGATPNGRLAGQPLSQNYSPTEGVCKNGVTAMLNSAARIPHGRVASGALNIRFQRNLIKGQQGLERLSQLLKIYFKKGGLQVQLSVADTAELRDAQINPDKHRDLMVRITGYSACFIDMTRNAQDSIIHRDEMGQ